MASLSPREGPGRFQWNDWAWFGMQIGSTIWLLIMGVIYAFKDARVGGLVLGCFLLANALGAWLWQRRDRLLPYPAILMLIAAVGIASAAALATLDYFGYLADFDPASPRRVYVALLVFPILLLRFYLLERHALKAEKEPVD